MFWRESKMQIVFPRRPHAGLIARKALRVLRRSVL